MLFRSVSQSRYHDVPTLYQINSITHEELISINGIGDFYANQIIKYRDQLGGYYSIEQLLEVWKMTEDIYLKIKDKFVIDKDHVKKMNLNEIALEELAQHPYFRWNLAQVIIKYRTQHGNFQLLEQLKQIKLVDEEKYNKIINYISIQ